MSAPRPLPSEPIACATPGCRNATVYETCSVCRRVLLWSGGRLVCATRDCARWGKAA
jgi:hypothetical protein